MKKNSLRKKLFLLAGVFAFICAQDIFASPSEDPQDDFYATAQGWYVRGIVSTLPQLRPYSVYVIERVLSEAREYGTEADAALADLYDEEIFGRGLKIYAGSEADVKVSPAAEDKESHLFPVSGGINGTLGFFDGFVSFGYKTGITGRTEDDAAFRLLYTNASHDGRYDPATVGPYKLYIDADTVLSCGTENTFAQAGINRNGYGIFLNDGFALNDTCFHKGNISFSHMNEKFSFTQLVSIIGATDNDGDAFPQGNKFFAFHAVDMNLTKDVVLSYYETMVYGKRFDPVYFIPTPFMIAQGLGGYEDNLQMGIRLDWRIIPGLLWANDLFVDDISFNELVKLNLDSRNRVAVRTGLVYVPPVDFCTRMALDFMVITPYTYSHFDSASDGVMYASTYNFQNNTNNGVNIGTSLPPDSAAVTFSADFHPLSRLLLHVDSRFALHGNVCESLTDEEAMRYLLADKGVYSTDGSIYTHQFTNEGILTTANEHLNFLTQNHLMYLVQAGVDAQYALKKYVWGKLSFTSGLDFEYIHNSGVGNAMYPGGQVTENTDGSYSINGSGNYTQEETVAYFKDLWVSKLTDTANLFFSIGFRYEF